MLILSSAKDKVCGVFGMHCIVSLIGKIPSELEKNRPIIKDLAVAPTNIYIDNSAEMFCRINRKSWSATSI